jgi:outer membrane protein OmpA-like peptidoglycan-associated protein
MMRWLWAIVGALVIVALGWWFWPVIHRTTAVLTAPTPAAHAPTPLSAARTPPASTAAQAPGPAIASQAPAASTAAQAPASVPAEQAPAASTATQAPAPAPAAQAPAASTAQAPNPAPVPQAPAASTAGQSPNLAPQASAASKAEQTPTAAPAPGTSSASTSEQAPAAGPAATAAGASAAQAGDTGDAANDKAANELASLKPGFIPKDLVKALNDSPINFPTGSSQVPASITRFIDSAAGDLRQLPKGSVLEIAGYTDNTGDARINLELSQRRASAVREALIKAGANPKMLLAKGYGSADPIAGNDTPEGRERNRRIEYRVVKEP